MNNKLHELPPQNLEAEQQVLGACMLDSEALGKAREVLTAGDFYRQSHQTIFEAMLTLADAGTPCDLVSLIDHLNSDLAAVGGQSYLAELVSLVPTAANIRYHAEIVSEKALRRKVLQAGQSLVEGADHEDLSELLGRLDKLKALQPGGNINPFISIADVMAGDEETEYLIDGLLPQDALLMLSGPPGHYKTMLALSMADAVSMGKPFLGRPTVQRPVYYIDRENIRITHKNYCRLLGIGESSSIKLWPLYGAVEPPPLPDRAYLGLKDALVVFDSLIRFYPTGTNENATEHINPVMSYLRGLAKRGNTVVFLHHVAKSAESDYRGTTDILAAVDAAFRIHRHGEGSRKLSLRCFKSRFYEETGIPFEVVQHAGGGLAFDTAPDRDAEDVEALHDLMEGRTLNQSQIFDLARDRLGLKNKGRLIHLLKEGEGHYWERVREGRRVMYCPNNCLSTVSPYRGGDSKTVDKNCSERQETVGGNGEENIINNQHLSNCPGGAETGETDNAIEVVEVPE